jgi:hypothetical protein
MNLAPQQQDPLPVADNINAGIHEEVEWEHEQEKMSVE